MCGIVGLFLKSGRLEPELGALAAAMLEALSDRGPDSAGFAIYRDGGEGRVKLTLRAVGDAGEGDDDDERVGRAMRELGRAVGAPVEWRRRGTHLLAVLPAAAEAAALAWLAERRAELRAVGVGRRMELYKEVGRPGDVARAFGLGAMRGSHAVGHTRMATESAVTTDGAHPFSTGRDQCLVHNGSLSNHNDVRRRLRRAGLGFATENDSEVAAGYVTWRMREGLGLGAALEAALVDLDGFYTFVVGTETGFAVLRDPIACKPAVMAETDDYVAFGSEYRALAVLPGVAAARVFEPEPARVYAWERG